jgi:hypothetical protein
MKNQVKILLVSAAAAVFFAMGGVISYQIYTVSGFLTGLALSSVILGGISCLLFIISRGSSKELRQGFLLSGGVLLLVGATLCSNSYLLQ